MDHTGARSGRYDREIGLHRDLPQQELDLLPLLEVTDSKTGNLARRKPQPNRTPTLFFLSDFFITTALPPPNHGD